MLKTQDEIIGAIENIIMDEVNEGSSPSYENAFQQVSEFYNNYAFEDGYLELKGNIAFEMSMLMVSVKGAKAVERGGDAIAEISGMIDVTAEY